MSTAAAALAAAVERQAAELCALSRSIHAEPEPAHACGHNIIAASTGAAPALREIADRLDLTIKLLGTSAEEFGGGKALLLERGVFKDVAMAMTVHPAPEETCACSSLAITVAQVAVGLLRQHLESGQMLHGILTHGGAAPTIVPSDTSALYLRAIDVESLQQLETRGRSCFEAAAVATGCTHEVTQVSPVYTQFVPDPWLAAAYRAAITGLGRSPRSPEDERNHQLGSTDMGNVPQSLPAIHPTIAIDCGDAVNHQPEFAAACATPSADRAGCDGALALALTGLAVATDDAQRDRLIGGVSQRRTAPVVVAGGAV